MLVGHYGDFALNETYLDILVASVGSVVGGISNQKKVSMECQEVMQRINARLQAHLPPLQFPCLVDAVAVYGRN